MTPLESYIRLGTDVDKRRKTILSLRKEKLDMTYKFIQQKTAGIDCSQPHEFSDMFDKFGKHYCVNFTISRYDGVSIYQVARGIYNQLTEKDETLNEAIGITAHRQSTGTLKCNYMHQRVISRPKQTGINKKMPDMESNGVFYCRFGNNSAVLATDYVDQDELHPYDDMHRIRKDISSGVVLTAHDDVDGKKYVVMKRYIMAKLHMYPHKVSQKQQDRFFLNMFHSHDSMKRLVVDGGLQRSDAGCSFELENFVLAMQHLQQCSSDDHRYSLYSEKRRQNYLGYQGGLHALEESVKALREELTALQEAKEDGGAKIGCAETEIAILEQLVRNQQFGLASAQSMVFGQLEHQDKNPLYAAIRLPKTSGARHDTLLAIKDTRFSQAHSYLRARSHHLDTSKDQYYGDTFEDDNGNLGGHRFEVVHFRGVQSLKQVYDAIVSFMFNMKISASETLSNATVQEDCGSVQDDMFILNHRLVSKHESGVISEANASLSGQYFEGQNEIEKTPCAIVTMKSVDGDDLHPYDPANRVRRDVTMALVLTEKRHNKMAAAKFNKGEGAPGSNYNTGDCHDDLESDVVMVRAIFLKVYRPNFEVSEDTLADVYSCIAQWPTVMVQAVREAIATHAV
ncbi:unnamed protein product [Phytophthora lilii]|uniref:Unnamed protein product n=1 Tax=Phytophthora lilii TaxID=2077276 RepID=A0A9W6TUE2_9STRA|nr:unnamed protein product [Phytophthora lilii]